MLFHSEQCVLLCIVAAVAIHDAEKDARPFTCKVTFFRGRTVLKTHCQIQCIRSRSSPLARPRSSYMLSDPNLDPENSCSSFLGPLFPQLDPGIKQPSNNPSSASHLGESFKLNLWQNLLYPHQTSHAMTRLATVLGIAEF